MNDQPQPHTPDRPTVDVARRRLFRGAAGGVGVVLSVQAKTALGTGVCQSPSAQMSGNQSPRTGDGSTCAGGRSPGFWKQPKHFGYWGAAGATEPTFATVVDTCAANMSELTLETQSSPGTTLVGVGFAGAPPGLGLWAVMAFPGEFDGGQLMRHLAAAWLNAGYFRGAGARYPLTQDQVIEMWNATKAGGLYCPASLLNCGASGWSKDDVIFYIGNLWDDSDVEPNLCKKNNG